MIILNSVRKLLLNLIVDVKTGNVVLGSGFDLPSRYIIHAMEPGMNAKFKSAVENAVHSKCNFSFHY